MGRLTDIGLKFGTDKAEHHGFTDFYEEYFERFPSPTILEIGIFDGASLRMYDEFWEGRAKIVGVDIQDKSSGFTNHRSIKTIVGDILEPTTIKKIREYCPDQKHQKYDIIIDDGGHTMEQQQRALINLWPLLKEGGLFIMEDLHTSHLIDYNPTNTTTTLSIIEGLQKDLLKPSKHASEEELAIIAKDVHDVLIWDNSWGAENGRPAKMSLTSIIIKSVQSEPRLVKSMIEVPKVPDEKTAQVQFASTENYIKTSTENLDDKGNKKKTTNIIEPDPAPAVLYSDIPKATKEDRAMVKTIYDKIKGENKNAQLNEFYEFASNHKNGILLNLSVLKDLIDEFNK